MNKGVSQFDTLLLIKGGQSYVCKLGSSLYCQTTGIMTCLDHNGKLNHSIDSPKDIGIEWWCTQSDYQQKSSILMVLKPGHGGPTFQQLLKAPTYHRNLHAVKCDWGDASGIFNSQEALEHAA